MIVRLLYAAAVLLVGAIGFVVGVEVERAEGPTIETRTVTVTTFCDHGESSIGPVEILPDGTVTGDTIPEVTGC